LKNKGMQTCIGIGLALQGKTAGYENSRNIKKRGVPSTGSFATGNSFGLSRCSNSFEKYRKRKLSYGIAGVCSFEPNGLTGKYS
jgi:hypothetical protein